MRPGLFKKIQVPQDSDLSRVQDNVKDAIEVLAADHDVLSAPVTTLVVTGNIPAGKSVVVFRGNAGQTLTLPQAKAQGANTAAIVVLANTSANALTLKPTAGDTINGAMSLTVAGGSVVMLSSDGVTKWLAPTSSSSSAGTWTDFTQDLGKAYSGTFDITGLSGLTAGKNVAVVQTAQPIVSKGGARDEFEMSDIQLTGYVVDATTIRVYWNADDIVVGTYAFAYQVGG